jgi:predicted Ser/Thr protein kinase
MFYEEVSFENLVLFYRDELIKVRKGVKAMEVLSKYDIKKLRRKKILYLTGDSQGGRRVVLTEKARKILEKTYEQPAEVTSTPRISAHPLED